MNIEKNTVVQLHYRLSEGNDLIESSHDHQPLLYLHGHNGMLPAVETALTGKQAGDKLELVLTPEQAYGERRADAIQSIQVKHLRGAKKWAPGMVAVVDTEQGPRQVTVVKVGMFKADIDINHPLAGKTLTFNLEVLDVREATAEEVEHGHAHGVGGHQHH
jgi:FKBP-type peptidyl-prolyl cis-trans isomerase SlyD